LYHLANISPSSPPISYLFIYLLIYYFCNAEARIQSWAVCMMCKCSATELYPPLSNFIFLRLSLPIQAGLKCVILLPQHPGCWDYRCAPSHLPPPLLSREKKNPSQKSPTKFTLTSHFVQKSSAAREITEVSSNIFNLNFVN
jgi:hypothetical protein